MRMKRVEGEADTELALGGARGGEGQVGWKEKITYTAFLPGRYTHIRQRR